MNLNISPRLMFGAAIVGVVGAAGVFIYEQLYAEKRRTLLVQEVARLDKQVTSMRTELEALRELQKESQLHRLKQKKKRVRREPKPRPPAAGAGDAVDGAKRADGAEGVEVAERAELSYASDSEYFTDYQSVLGTDGDMDSEEFYDVHTDDDSDDDTLREPLANGHAASVFDEDLSDKLDSPKKSSKKDT